MSKHFKVIAFVDSSNALQLDYIKNQVEAIKNQFPEVTFDIQNELSPLFQYSKHKRVPCYMCFKNGIYKIQKAGKLNDTQAIDWIKFVTS